MPGTSYAPAELGNGPAAYAHRSFPDAGNIASLQAEIRALARERAHSFWPTIIRCPRCRMSPTSSVTRSVSPWRRSALTWQRPFTG